MTKPITSVALMMLYEEGAFLLENPIGRFIPEMADLRVWDGGTAEEPQSRPAPRPVTVHDVLTHLAGFTYGFHHQHPLDEMYRARGLRSEEHTSELPSLMRISYAAFCLK